MLAIICIIIVALAIFVTLIVSCALIAASRADDEMEKAFDRSCEDIAMLAASQADDGMEEH